VAAAAPAARHGFETDLRAALQTASEANVPKTVNARNKIFASWVAFCESLGKHPSLCDVLGHQNKLSYLLVFGHRYRKHGRNSGQNAVRAGTVASALLAVGEGITNLGYPDPRKLAPGNPRNHPVLAAYLKRLGDEDGPSTRVYPANVTILRTLPDVLDFDHVTHGQINRCIINITIVAFFWLLRPAEYLHVSDEPQSRSQAFLLRDVGFEIEGRLYNASQAPLNDLNDVAKIAKATLTFNDQKNAVRGEQVSHRATDDTSDWALCPCKALGRVVLHLLQNGATPDTPLYTVYNGYGPTGRSAVTPAFITNAIRHAATALEPTTGVDPWLLSARSLRPGGATALLCAGVPGDAIQLLGRWKSHAMLEYLRVQALTHAQNFAQRMLDHGSYTFSQQPRFDDNIPIPNEAPATFLALLDAEEDE